MGLLKGIVKTRPLVVKVEITKVDECGERVEFTYKSEPVKVIITESEFEKMTNLIGPRPVLKLPTVVNNNNNNVYSYIAQSNMR